LSQPRRNIDLVGSRKIWYAISLAVILPGMLFFFYRWSTRGEPLNFGVDFTGGTAISYKVERPFGSSAERIKVIEEVRDIAAKLGAKARVEVEGDNVLTVNTSLTEGEASATFATALTTALEEHFSSTYGKVTAGQLKNIGPLIGSELKRKAVLALIVGLLLIVLYISSRYDFKFAICAIIALVHDVLVVVGVMAMSGMVVNSEFVAVLLTVVGFSVHDTVVIFDRIRENLRLRKMDPFHLVVNDSLWQTMARSVNTVLTVLFIVLLLFFRGGSAIHSFAFALLVGITTGAYSSIFNASQILVSWKGREVSVRQRVVAARAADRMKFRGGAPTAVNTTRDRASSGQEKATVPSGTADPEPGTKPSPVGARTDRPKKKVGGKRKKRF